MVRLRRAFGPLVAIGLALGMVGLLLVGPVAAQQTPTATRSLSATTVAAGGQVTVTINASDYGQFGAVVETLPAGFSYVEGACPILMFALLKMASKSGLVCSISLSPPPSAIP